MHRLLKRQIRKHLGEGAPIPPDLQSFLDSVETAYDQYDADRKLLERSMEISSDELYNANLRLQEEMANQELILSRLKASVRALQDSTEGDLDDEDVLSISRMLQLQIEKRNEAEEALREREQRLQLILDATPDSIFTLDPHGIITSWNDGAQKITGYSAQEAIGNSVAMLSPSPEDARSELSEAALTGFARSEGWRQRKDGSLYWGEATLSVLRDPMGRVRGYVKVGRDMTQRRRDDEALRTTKEAAEAASRAKSEFLANMSHEIRTPMNAVIGMTGLLEDTPLTEEQREMVATIQSSGGALLSLISGILDLSKIEAGKLTLQSDRFDLRKCVDASLEVFGPLVKDEAVRLALNYHASAPAWVKSDETRIRQVLFNLIGNAVKFTNKGEIVVSVSARRRDGQVWYHISVRDTGIGIEAAQLRSIFQPFSQVESAYSRTSGGTGLGLAISKRLVEALGGEIWVESQVGEGSTFHFTFVVPEVSQESPRAAYRAPDREPVSPAVDLKVLVVEDNPTNQKVVSRLLERAGVLPDVVENGAQAVEMAKSEYYDLMFMDVQMPVMNGLDATSSIRLLRVRQPHIVALTANAMPEDRARCLEAGMDEYLSKPILLDDLRRVINRFLSSRPGAADANGH